MRTANQVPVPLHLHTYRRNLIEDTIKARDDDGTLWTHKNDDKLWRSERGDFMPVAGVRIHVYRG